MNCDIAHSSVKFNFSTFSAILIVFILIKQSVECEDN